MAARGSADSRATIDPTGDVVAGSFGTWTITITVGHHGVDDSGTILVARRMSSDWGTPQFDRPGEAEFTTVTTTGDAKLRVWFDNAAHVRPWKPALVIRVYDGTLAPGDQVVVTFGDRRGGGPGSRAQGFPEERHGFAVFVDSFGTNQFQPIEPSPSVRIVGGPAARLRVIAPSWAVVGQPVAVTVKVEDQWGNPSPSYAGEVTLALAEHDAPVATHRFTGTDRGVHRFDGIVLARPGTYRVVARDAASGLTADGNPVVCAEARPERALYWGDIHGQSGATVGTGSIDEYFRYGRDAAGLDFLSHCANDFQITREHWNETRETVRRYHEPGRFVTFLAYEWSGNTPNGGDHNVYFRGDDGTIHRSSHWQVADLADADADRCPVSALHDTFRGSDDVMILPHIGGRRANLDFFDPAFAPVIEIQSVHGLFWWFADEALARGLRVGFIAGSDDHTGRPGSTFPSSGSLHFGVRGGLIAAYAADLTRDALWEAIRQRRCYGTTGERIIVAVEADGHPMGSEYRATNPPRLSVRVVGTAPLERVDLYRGTERIYRHPLRPVARGQRLQVVWSGLRGKSRHRDTIWHGGLAIDSGRIVAARPFAFDSPSEGIVEQTERTIRWRSTTCGDPDGVFLDLEDAEDATLRFDAGPIQFALPLTELGDEPRVVEAGGVEQRVEVAWAPAEPTPPEIEFTFVDAGIHSGVNPYWIRLRQMDGAIAWSSPIYVEFAP